jgi:hypothetical protein
MIELADAALQGVWLAACNDDSTARELVTDKEAEVLTGRAFWFDSNGARIVSIEEPVK